MKVKEESEKVSLKLNIQKTEIMASGPITSWQIDGETKETVTDFILGGSKITADGDCSHEIKRCLLLGRKAMTKLDSILKSRDIALPTKVHIVKAMVFPVVMYRCESWTIKKAERQRIDAFELWCWRRLFESPLDFKEIQLVHAKGNQSWLFIRRTDAEAETPIIWPPDAKNWLNWKDPDAGKDWRWEEKGTIEDEMGGWHDCDDAMDMSLSKLWSWWWTGKPGVLQSMGSQRVWHDWATELTELALRSSLVVQLVKNPLAMRETWVLLENETATHSSILAWRIPWTV